MNYTTGCHTIFHRRYHIVGVLKYCYKVLQGEIRERIRTIILQICSELRVEIISGVFSSDNIHMFVEILLQIGCCDSRQEEEQDEGVGHGRI